MNALLEPARLGDLNLKNRIVMAPMTRARAGASRVPNDVMADYYSQRASAGFILTEATVVTPQGIGYADTPGIWSHEQIEGWKKTTAAVHRRGGFIFLQLWHVGRISDPMFLNGELPVAPSAIAPKGNVSLVRPEKPFVVPRALERSEIPIVIEAFRKGAQNAKLAGFDGVEIHGANGYLPDQFLQSSTNRRTDDYGGPIENRAKFLLQVVDAAVSVWGPDRVGVHLSPRADAHDMGDDNLKETFGHVARELGKRKIAFIFLRDAQGEGYLTPYLKEQFGGTVIANQKLTPELAEALVREKKADLVSFGTLYISNPDLVERIRAGGPFNETNPSTIYAAGAMGYSDYPFLPRLREAK
ncbi:MAG TPA: alkene reductase [Elusimicrobiota bacterium]|jgi:NADPH2 dehydrogenase|nr:alkene reductase [Elusimicrobiota bacterium]